MRICHAGLVEVLRLANSGYTVPTHGWQERVPITPIFRAHEQVTSDYEVHTWKKLSHQTRNPWVTLVSSKKMTRQAHATSVPSYELTPNPVSKSQIRISFKRQHVLDSGRQAIRLVAIAVEERLLRRRAQSNRSPISHRLLA